MAFDNHLADRLRALLSSQRGFSERKMFGGIAFMVNGHMCCGIVKSDLMLRLGGDAVADALKRPHARPMDFTGRDIKSMIYVGPEGFDTDAALEEWVDLALRFVRSLPPKK